PPGVVGELYLGGAGLARGYLGRAELTAERFLPHPYSSEPGARLYRTGDLVRYQPDGTILFVGRNDEQIKVRGYRVELGEIEAALREHEGVVDVVVMAQPAPGAGEKHLVAYVVPGESAALTREGMQSFLRRTLPEYMIPAALVPLSHLPLLPHGKVDRRALPAPDTNHLQLDEHALSPRGPIEELLAELWVKVLGVQQVGVHDNFFALGGHSLLAIRVISHLRKVFRRELPLRSLFEIPTVAGMASYILEQVRQGNKDIQPPPSLKRESRSNLPLSFAQQRLWFLDQLEPDSSLYNIRTMLSLQGSLNLVAFTRSLQEIVRRHEVLRTTFTVVDDAPRQCIASSLFLQLPVVDIQTLPSSTQQDEIHLLAVQETQRPFDLARGPLLRVTLLRLASHEHLLLLTMHHIVSDEWSLEIFGRELSILYRAYSQEKPSPLGEVQIQYADFALWQRQWLQGQVLQTQLDYWREHLRGAPAILELPADHPRPAVKTFRGGIVSFMLSVNVSEALKALSIREGATLFMTLLAAFQMLLAHYSGLKDIVVGSPITNRTRVEIESLIGLFLNTLVLRTNLSGNPTFQELLLRVREVALQAYTHQDLPFEKLVDELSPERDLNHNPLFQVMFVLQNAVDQSFELADLTLKPIFVERGTTKFDLTLFLANSQQGIEGKFAYSMDLFEATTIERMATHFQRLLEEIIAAPQRRIFDLPILTRSEQGLIHEWNATQVVYPQHECLHTLIEAQMVRSADAVAVVYAEEQISYQALDRLATQLAHRLHSLGVHPEERVGLCLEPGVAMVVALLAILKAGGTYVPLDHSSPPQRLAFLLQDASISLLLTQQAQLSHLPLAAVTALCLDSEWEAITDAPATSQPSSGHPAQAAYLLYTSGSTGQPKGVLVEQRSLLNYVFAVQQRLGLGVAGSFAMLQPLTVDSCLTMLFPALLCGGTLHLFSRELVLDAHALAIALSERPADYLKIAPSHLAALLSAASAESLLPRRCLILGGEASQEQWVQELLGCLQAGAQLFNHYGPTEATVGVLTYPISNQTLPTLSQFTPLGTPLANSQAYV
ncbi:MAG TPA: condensation domain-containing protein, partial [Ktedonosporobacter sp.]|nr:condensation domain-containing protein [Ktedonosporobacter sp.]